MPSGKLVAPFRLSWSQYVFLISIDNPDERRFYEIEADSNGWSLPELKRQFNSGLYGRLALSRDKDGVRKLARKGSSWPGPQTCSKSPICWSFSASASRRNIRNPTSKPPSSTSSNIPCWNWARASSSRPGRSASPSTRSISSSILILYNRLLRCYVLIDLKIGKLTHQHLGQMQMYVNYFDRFVKLDEEHPTVGIILCRKKHDALVEITLPEDTNIHAQEYQFYLPDKELLRQKLVEWGEEAERKRG